MIFVDNVDKEDLQRYGKLIAANREVFPQGTNLDLVQVLDEKTIKIRTYERGIWDETLACGTGATASAAVYRITGRSKADRITVHVRGGELIIEILKNRLYMIGPASKVYTGKTIFYSFTFHLFLSFRNHLEIGQSKGIILSS